MHSDRIKYDPQKEAPVVSIDFSGDPRVDYHVRLLNPKVRGEILKERHGNSYDEAKDEFSIEHTGNDLEFAPLWWKFEIWPTPNIPEQEYGINLSIEQEGELIFSRIYQESEVSTTEIITGKAVFIT